MRAGRALFLCCITLVVGGACTTGEVCDNEQDDDGDGLADCADPGCGLFPACTACGDGLLDDAEACDDGNANDSDACSNRCELKGCGDGVAGPGEVCDDGNRVPGDGCNDRCVIDHCANRRVENGEECDDGNLFPGDGCSPRCRIEPGVLCGNARFDPGEQCDDGGRVGNDGCSADCVSEFCGDGVLQTRLGEVCDGDDGVGPGERCEFCQLNRCGNGRLDVNEECDDGNSISGDACSATCKAAGCANGAVEADEECDDGNLQGDDGCDAVCRAERCGDGRVQGREVCDDDDDDGCVGCIPTVFVRGGQTFGVDVLLGDSLFPPVRGVSAADDDGTFFVSMDFRTEQLGVGDGALVPGPLGATAFMSQPERVDLDQRQPIDVVGCGNGNVVLDVLARTHVLTQFGLGCLATAGADVDDDGVAEVYSLGSFGLSRLSPPFSTGRVDFLGPVATRLVAPGMAALRGAPDRLVVVSATNEVLQLDAAGALVGTKQDAELVFGADLDDDGDDELLRGIGDTVIVDDVAFALGFAPLRFARGDVDSDGVDDVIITGRRLAALLLSGQGHVPDAPLAAPLESAAVVVDGALLLIGGPNFQPATVLRVQLQR